MALRIRELMKEKGVSVIQLFIVSISDFNEALVSENITLLA
jgi:hypothetical protein